jgi:hypothetical protein
MLALAFVAIREQEKDRPLLRIGSKDLSVTLGGPTVVPATEPTGRLKVQPEVQIHSSLSLMPIQHRG